MRYRRWNIRLYYLKFKIYEYQTYRTLILIYTVDVIKYDFNNSSMHSYLGHKFIFPKCKKETLIEERYVIIIITITH